MRLAKEICFAPLDPTWGAMYIENMKSGNQAATQKEPTMNAYRNAVAATDDAFAALQAALANNAPQEELDRLRAIVRAAYERVPLRPYAPF